MTLIWLKIFDGARSGETQNRIPKNSRVQFAGGDHFNRARCNPCFRDHWIYVSLLLPNELIGTPGFANPSAMTKFCESGMNNLITKSSVLRSTFVRNIRQKMSPGLLVP